MKVDTYRHKGMREQLCDLLREQEQIAHLRQIGISDELVQTAMRKVCRHWFIDSSLDNMAYEDRALPILCDQTISQPSTVALQSQLLELKPGMKVLEVGTGSGYQTAVLCAMGAKVFSIERQKGLFDKTKRLLMELHYTAKCFLGDGYQGITEIDCSPYDRVLITCGAPYVPQPLMEQLVVGGIMVIPLGEGTQRMIRIHKKGETPDSWVMEEYGDCQFVPMLGGKNF